MNERDNTGGKQSPTAADIPEIPQMNFGDAMNEVLKGRHVRRLEWEERNARFAIMDNQLMVYKEEDKKFHPLIVSTGDIAGEDWVVTEEKEVTIN